MFTHHLLTYQLLSGIGLLGCLWVAYTLLGIFSKSTPIEGKSKILPLFLPWLFLICLPLGSLPPLLDTSWSGLFCLLPFILSRKRDPGLTGSKSPYKALARPKRQYKTLAELRPQSLHLDIFLTLLLGVLAAYVWQRGVPGSPFNWGTYVATPLWSTVSIVGRMGLSCLLFALLLVLPFALGAPRRKLMLSAVLVTVFFPYATTSLGSLGRMDTLLFAWLDFIIFWLKIAVIVFIHEKLATRFLGTPVFLIYLLLFAAALLLFCSLWQQGSLPCS